jgi:hypothetical protein
MTVRRRTPDEIRIELHALYAQIATQNQDEIPDIAEHIVLVMQADAQPIDRTRLAFRTCDTATTHKEIAEIRKLASSIVQRINNPRSLTGKSRRSLADRLETLHKPTIDALANSKTVIDVGALRIRFPQSLRQGNIDTLALGETLHMVIEACDGAPLIETTDEGRSQYRRDQVVARMLANAYATLTGKEPTFSVHGKPRAHVGARKIPYAGARILKSKKEPGPQGPYLGFVSAVFFCNWDRI